MEEPSHVSQINDLLADPTGNKQLALPASSRPVSPAFATVEIPKELFHHDENSDRQSQGPDDGYGYNPSESSTQPSSSSDILAPDVYDEELAQLIHSRTSSRSSISSLPDSVLIHRPDGQKHSLLMETDDPHEQILHTHHWVDDHNGEAEEGHGHGHGHLHGHLKPMHVHTLRQREAAFRKPSSVRAMLMHTEDEDEGDDDDNYLTPPRRRVVGTRNSDVSMRPAAAAAAGRTSPLSPLKRSPYYHSPSPGRSASRQQKAKKEYPLVLLHCTLLSPSLPVPGFAGQPPSQKILREVLPHEYWKRWKLLEEKVGSGVLRDRGVLISHPEDMYDLLEERLLESLELQRPRLHHGHFMGHEEGDSDKEDHRSSLSSPEESATDDEQGEACLDCGGRVVRNNNHGRKWEIKVFAANGLMRAGAWAAAWKEMEKVDVEVGLWLPTEIRRELEKRLLDNEPHSSENSLQMHQPLNDPPLETVTDAEQEQYPPQAVTGSDDAGSGHFVHDKPTPLSYPEQAPPQQHQERKVNTDSTYHSKPAQEIELQTLLGNYIRVLASDRRNVAIGILGVLAVYLAMMGVRAQSSPISHLRPFPQDMFESVPASSVSLQSFSTSWAVDRAHSSISDPATSEVSVVVESGPASAVTVSESTSMPLVPSQDTDEQNEFAGKATTATVVPEDAEPYPTSDNPEPVMASISTEDNLSTESVESTEHELILESIELSEPMDAVNKEPVQPVGSTEQEPILESTGLSEISG